MTLDILKRRQETGSVSPADCWLGTTPVAGDLVYKVKCVTSVLFVLGKLENNNVLSKPLYETTVNQRIK